MISSKDVFCNLHFVCACVFHFKSIGKYISRNGLLITCCKIMLFMEYKLLEFGLSLMIRHFFTLRDIPMDCSGFRVCLISLKLVNTH